MVGIHRFILAFCPPGLIAGAFQLELPLAVPLGRVLLKLGEYFQGQREIGLTQLDRIRCLQDRLNPGSTHPLYKVSRHFDGNAGIERDMPRKNIGIKRSLAHAAEAVGAGDLSVQAPVESEDEFGTLATTFNSMTFRLRGLIDSLEQRMLERKQAEAELRRSQEALRENQILLQSIIEH